MIARCPKCEARYRIPAEKIGPRGARVRCRGCGETFRVVSPGSTTAPAREPLADPPAAAPPVPDSGACAIVAESDPRVGKEIVGLLESRGVASTVVPDGGQALLRVFRSPPELLVVGGRLPGVPGPVVTEIVRRAENLRALRVVRVTGIDGPPGAPEFEADLTIEPADLPHGLEDALDRFGSGTRPESPVVETPSSPEGEGTKAEPSRPAVEPAASPPADPRIAQAERLARIIVADIVLYNEDRFDRAACEENLEEALKAELAEGRALFQSRVPDDVRSERDFITEEIERVCAERRRRSGA